MHTYAAPGRYRITLTASNAGGTGTPSSQTITVGDTGPALTAAHARAAMRRFLSHRLKHWRTRSLSCHSLNRTHAACSFRATRRGRKASGSGTLTLRTPGRTVTGRLRVHLPGRHARPTTWKFRTIV
jgi:hypothetical protein